MCLKPNACKLVVDDYTGSIRSTFLGPAARLSPDDFGSYDDLATKGSAVLMVPCGTCPECRLHKASDWSNRCLMELERTPGYAAIFVTLTYRPADVPCTDSGLFTLNKRDVALFMKRLRKRFSSRRIRFFLCGEYGSRTHRPHYHAILFGLSINDFPDSVVKFYNNLSLPVFTSGLLDDIWSKGLCSIGSVTAQSCNYVARYCMKKFNDDFDLCGRVPPFIQMSRRPGIGLIDAESYVDSSSDHVQITVPGSVKSFPIPSSVLRCISRRKNSSLNTIDKCAILKYTRNERSDDILTACRELNLPISMVLEKASVLSEAKLRLLPERSSL